MKLNCLGDMCPLPLLKAEQALKRLSAEESLMVVTDHSCVVESIHEHFSARRCTLSIAEAIPGVWEISIARKPSEEKP